MKKGQFLSMMLVLEVCILLIAVSCFFFLFALNVFSLFTDTLCTGFTEIVQYILSFAANAEGCATRMLNTVDAEGDTPLHHAARGEHMDTVKLLLEAGACPKKENAYGQAAAEMADQDTEVRALLTAKQVEASIHMAD
uniref:Uncharacterized protein n=1 Tax=Aegilops tauschii subsp. strangulata TaxID=200361 RepID=A0A453J010_AEGTS